MSPPGRPRIVILTIGTLGDVQPFAALGAGLKQAGFDVILASHGCFAGFIDSCGLGFAPLAGDPLKWAEGSELSALARSGGSFLRWMFTLRSLAGPLMRQILDSCWQACRGAEAVIYSPFAWACFFPS